MKASIQILAGNCEKTIERCLNSLPDCEISIVYDTRNTDNTQWILADMQSQNPTIKIYEYDWASDSFSDARNFGLSKCTGDYIFYIDADEELIIPADFKINPNVDFYLCKVFKDGELFYFPRIFRNGLGRPFRGARHNEMDLSGLKGEYCDVTFNGLTMTTPEERLAKTRSLLQRHYKQLHEEPWNYSLHFRIANCYKVLGNWERCEEFSNLALGDNINFEATAQLYLNLYFCYKRKGNSYTAGKCLERSIAMCPEQRQAKMFMYEDLMKAGEIDEANLIKQQVLDTTFSPFPLDIQLDRCNEIFNQYNLITQ